MHKGTQKKTVIWIYGAPKAFKAEYNTGVRCRAGIETQTKRKDVWTPSRGEEGRMNWEIRLDINILPCVNG